MRRRDFIASLSSAAMWPLAANAQQPGHMRQLGVLMPFDAQNGFGQEIIGALRDGLQQHGWIEGRNIRSDIRWIDGDEERRRAYAADLVRASPDVIFACFAAQLAALSRETSQIPLVFVGASDPVGLGFVASYAQPGGNITGFTLFEPSMVGKWLGVLKEVAPTITRVAVIGNPNTQKSYELYLAEFASAARAFNIETVSLLVHSPSEIESTIGEFAGKSDSGLIVLPDTFTTDHYELIVALASRYRLPTVFQITQAARSGGLLAYGPDQIDVIRRSASYIDRILKGERPAELPVQTPTKFELVINLTTAKALGILIPPTLLARADEVIE